jgi:hypothetical protein
MSDVDRAELGAKGIQHVQKNYNFIDFENKWVQIMLDVHEKHGSWKNRKNYNSWELLEA